MRPSKPTVNIFQFTYTVHKHKSRLNTSVFYRGGGADNNEDDDSNNRYGKKKNTFPGFLFRSYVNKIKQMHTHTHACAHTHTHTCEKGDNDNSRLNYENPNVWIGITAEDQIVVSVLSAFERVILHYSLQNKSSVSVPLVISKTLNESVQFWIKIEPNTNAFRKKYSQWNTSLCKCINPHISLYIHE